MSTPLKIRPAQEDKLFLSQMEKLQKLKASEQEANDKSEYVERNLIETISVPILITHCQLGIIRRLSQLEKGDRAFSEIPAILNDIVPKIIRKHLILWTQLTDLKHPQVDAEKDRFSIITSVDELLRSKLSLSGKLPPEKKELSVVVLPSLEDAEKGALKFTQESKKADLEKAMAHAKKETERLDKEYKLTDANLNQKKQEFEKAIQAHEKKGNELRRQKNFLNEESRKLGEQIELTLEVLERFRSASLNAAFFEFKVCILVSYKDQIIAGFINGLIWVLNQKLKKERQLEKSLSRPITALVVEEEKLAAGNDHGNICIWDLPSGRRAQLLGNLQEGAVSALKFLRDKNLLVSGNKNGSIFIWDISKLEALNSFKSTTRVDSLVFMEEGAKLAASGFYNDVIGIWDSKTEQDKNGKAHPPMRQMTWHTTTKSYVVTSTQTKAHSFVLVNERLAAAGCSDGTIHIWDKESDKVIKVIEGVKKPVRGIRPLLEQNKLAVLHENGTLRIFDIGTWQEEIQLELEWDSKASPDEDQLFLSNLTFVDGGKKLAIRNLDQSVLIWDLEVLREMETFLKNQASDLYAYCKIHCSDITYPQAVALIKEGQQLMRKILRDQPCLPSQAIEESQKELAVINWFLMYYALTHDQGYYSGSCVIEENNKLLNFIRASRGTDTRICSHFIGRPHDDWYGVDVRNGLMPAKKRTILLGLVSTFSSAKKALFFKPENFSPFLTTAFGYDAAMHTYELGKSQVNRTRKGANDMPGMQKERVPDSTLLAFQGLIDYLKNNIDQFRPVLNNLLVIDLDKAIDHAKLWGIAYMDRFAKNIESSSSNPDLRLKIQTLKDTYRKLDNLENRTGREVYINSQQLDDFVHRELHFDPRDRQLVL